MAVSQEESLRVLYEQDETAWLEAMADLIARRRFDELDHQSLGEFLTDMARRDRREVFSRLVVLLTHLLKWDSQPGHRTGSWRGSIRPQRRELRQLLESGTLRNHALTVFADAYAEARKQAADETETPLTAFPQEWPWEMEDALSDA